ncbi:hypothetical protein V6N12_049883 [Hibiscus sabdariffa]|uniref:SNF2 N-terminal domain-containing protein n=1 Tax=Hibiscus sabdariffa TaxID=183260 RepID=A0ABR2GAU0_9ROSI
MQATAVLSENDATFHCIGTHPIHRTHDFRMLHMIHVNLRQEFIEDLGVGCWQLVAPSKLPLTSDVVLCPLSVTDGWVSEIVKFTHKLEVLRYVGEKEHRRSLRKTIYEHVKDKSLNNALSLPFDVLLTIYDIALMDQDFLSQIPWHYAVIDEAQRLKNPSSV